MSIKNYDFSALYAISLFRNRSVLNVTLYLLLFPRVVSILISGGSKLCNL